MIVMLAKIHKKGRKYQANLMPSFPSTHKDKCTPASLQDQIPYDDEIARNKYKPSKHI